MVERVLIDSSAFIEFFREGDSEIALAVDQLLEARLAATCGVVKAELLQGTRSDREFKQLRHMLDALPCLPEPEDRWSHVARLGFDLRRAGVNGVRLPDLLIATVALHTEAPLLQRDAHFEAIARVRELRLLGAMR
jgi:predicted nucleic acid-binding protein